MNEASVVRLFVTTQTPDYDSPWQAHQAKSCTGSGVIVGPRRVLTGAHVVADATFIQVQKSLDSKKRVAKVIATCHDADLALIEIEAASFASKSEVAEIGELARMRDKVSVIGFPVGGDEVSVTEGVVSRVELQRYSHSQRYLLAVTVDAAINEGNSGGPVFKDGKVAGIAFQTLDDAENIGEMVPAPLIHRFLNSVELGCPSEVPSLSMHWQTLENEALRESVGLSGDESGILVRGVEAGGSAASALRAGDVLLAVHGYKIENNGTIQYRPGVRTGFGAVIGEHYLSDRLAVEIKRNGKKRRLSLTLQGQRLLVPRSEYDARPRYFIHCGLVLQPLSRNLLETWSDWWDKAPVELLHGYYHGRCTKQRRELIVLTHALADKITVGYGDHLNETIDTVNGQIPSDLTHLVELVNGAKGLVEFKTSSGACLVFNAGVAKAANRRVLKRYRINASSAL